jgi:hypothetical protein
VHAARGRAGNSANTGRLYFATTEHLNAAFDNHVNYDLTAHAPDMGKVIDGLVRTR